MYKRECIAQSVKSKDPKDTYIPSVQDIINDDVGLALFMKKTYITSGIGITCSIGLALLLHYLSFISFIDPLVYLGCLVVGFILSILGISGIANCKYSIWRINNHLVAKNSSKRELAYYLLTISIGLMLSPLVSIVSRTDPSLVPLAIILSIFTTGGASFYAYIQPNGSLLRWRAPLFAALSGLLGAYAVILLLALFGNYHLMYIFHQIDLYFGLLLFVAMTASDTHYAIKKYQQGDPDHLGCATEFYLNFINIFIRILEIVDKRKLKN